MVIIVARYLLLSLPEYKISVAMWKREGTRALYPPKRMLVIGKVVIIGETILFVGACLVFVLKCFGVIPWW